MNLTRLILMTFTGGILTWVCGVGIEMIAGGTVDVADLLTLIGDWGACE